MPKTVITLPCTAQEAGAVCNDCAKKAGFKPKNKMVGVWMDVCSICHKQKPCTDLIHDWYKPNKKEKK